MSFSGILLFLFLISALLLIPSIQTRLTNKAAQILSEKTGTKIEVGGVYIAFPKTVRLESIYAEDINKDTLIYLERLNIDAALFPLLRKKVSINRIEIQGLRGAAYRNQTDTSFNFSPILTAFSQDSNPDKSQGNKSNWDFEIDEVIFKNIHLAFSDHRDSIYYRLALGHFYLDANEVDLESLTFDFDKIEVSETSFSMKFPDGTNTSEKSNSSGNLPLKIKLESFQASAIDYQLDVGSDKLSMSVEVNQFEAEPELIDLENSMIVMEKITADGINTNLKSNSSYTTSVNEQNGNPINLEHTFGQFDWEFLIKQAHISNTNHKMDLNDRVRQVSGLDYMNMNLYDINVDADSIFFNQDETGAKIKSLSLRETSGPEIVHLTGDFALDNRSFHAQNIDFQAKKSMLNGQIKLTYPSFKEIGSKAQQIGIESRLNGKIVLEELKPFTGFVDEYSTLEKMSQIIVNNIEADGSLQNLAIRDADITIAENTRIHIKGKIAGLPGKNLNISYELDTLTTDRSDLLALSGNPELPQDIQIPQYYGLSSHGSTNLKNGKIQADLKTEIGEVRLQLDLENDHLISQMEFIDIDVGSILNDSTFGKTSLSCDVEGLLEDFKPQEIQLDTKVDYFEWNKNHIENSTFGLSLKDNIYNANLNVQDLAISASIESKYYLEDSVHHFDSNIQIGEIELQGLNLMDDYFQVSGKLAFDFEYINERVFTSGIAAKDIDLAKNDKEYHIENLTFSSNVNDIYSNFFLKSDFIDASLTGNTRLNELDSAILDHIDVYLTLPDSMISSKDFKFDFNLDMKQPEIFTDFLIPGLHAFQMDKCELHYSDAEDILNAEILIPTLDYEDIQLTDLQYIFNTQSDSALARLSLSEFLLNSISISNVGLQSVFEKEIAHMSFYTKDHEGQVRYHLKYTIDYLDSIYKIFIDPQNLVINYNEWKIPAENILTLTENRIIANSTNITNGEQQVSLNAIGDELTLAFKEFQLSNFTEILTNDSTAANLNGKINGNIAFSDLFSIPSVTTKIDITNLNSDGTIIGNLLTELKYQPDQPLTFDIILENDENRIRTNGEAIIYEDEQSINANLLFSLSDAKDFQPLFETYLSDLHGSITGKLNFKGDLADPVMNGDVNFNDLNTTITYTNSSFATNGQILVTNNLLSFNSFKIKDSKENQMTFNGKIDFGNLSDPLFNIDINSQDIVIINSPIRRKELIEGQLNLGLNIKINGSKSKLNIDNEISIREGTNLHYLMPGNELELITDEGIVEYVDFDQPEENVIVVKEPKFIGDSLVSMIKGIDFSTNVNIDPNATFTVVVDPNSGDYTEFNLGGKLNYSYNDSQKGRLIGQLEFQKGFYELSFYGLVKKRFDYKPGSIISWSGEVMDGTMNFSARHTVRTNSIGLVSNEISSYEKPLYNQRVPYDVILKIENKISDPVISFALDLPERYRTAYPTLDAKLNQLNQPSMESERYKQVFALLVGGTFIPEDPGLTEGSGGSNFATTAARNSVNAIMTQQLNNFTGQFIEGLDVDMGVNTFDDYGTGSAQTRTQLDVKVSKNLFNDRVTAEMESHINLDGSVKQVGGQNTAGMTEFAVSYKLTPAGNYRIKGFRENAYDIFDGEIQNSGIAFIYIKEFDRFRKKTSQDKANKQDQEIIQQE